MQAVLVMFRSDGERRSFSITRDVTTIGRREDADLRIPLGDVSRKHARLVREGDQMRLEDLGSSNGTFLNGARVERDAYLQAGDSIQVGPVVFVLQVDGYPADEELNPITAETAATAALLAEQGGDGATSAGVGLAAAGAVAAAGAAGHAAGLGDDGMDPLDAMGHEPAGEEGTANLDEADPHAGVGEHDLADLQGLEGVEPGAEHAVGLDEFDPDALSADDGGAIPLAGDDRPAGGPGTVPLSDDDGLDLLNDPNPAPGGGENLDDLLLDVEPEPPKAGR